MLFFRLEYQINKNIYELLFLLLDWFAQTKNKKPGQNAYLHV